MERNFVLLVLIPQAIAAFVGAECPDGFVHHGDTCYHFSHDQEYWNEAREICTIFGAYLVEINDVTEEQYLSSQVKLTGRTYWTGGNDLAVEGDWVWVTSGQKITGQSYTHWKTGEPNNYDGKQNCLEILGNGNWNDQQCGAGFNFYICEKPVSEGTLIG